MEMTMHRRRWHMVPLLLLAFLYFLAVSTAQDAAVHEVGAGEQAPLRHGKHSMAPAASARVSGGWGGEGRRGEAEEMEEQRREWVREAQGILSKMEAPTVSKLASYTRRPKGLLGSSVYYAKQAFVLLFMNAPPHDALIPSHASSPSASTLPQPLSRAVKLLQRAADAGSPDALFLLAELNFHGNHSHPVDYRHAFARYAQLAHLDGNATAHHMLGFMYATGLNPDVPTDMAKSLLYHTFAAEQGNTRSEMTLAYRNHAGVGTPRDCDEAVHWYKKVADKAIRYYRSGPPGGHVLVKDSYRLADEEGGVYGEGASVSSAGINAKQGGPTSDAYASIDDVLEYLHMQSAKGELKATFGLARLHYDGSRGLKRDLKLAKQHFLAVARQYWDDKGRVKKDVSASTEKMATKAAGYLGRMFLRAEGMKEDFGKAKIWFQRGVSNGDALSQYSLGLMYLDALGVERDVQKAASYFAAAADQDLPVAQTHLGILFLDQGDTRVATQYFEFAARNGHIEAFYYLAEMNNQAIGRDRTCGQAAVFYKIVAEKAEAIWSSLAEANAAYEDGDTRAALIAYLMAAEQGSENAQANVAWLLDATPPRWALSTLLSSHRSSTSDSTSRDATLALTHWTRSAKQSNTDALVKMGDHHLLGLGTPDHAPSPENAATCYQAAGDTGVSAQALWNLGWMHEHGVGMPRDLPLAKRAYDAALAANPREAYWPVALSLWVLRWRGWWLGESSSAIDGDEEDGAGAGKRRGFWEWVQAFLDADLQQLIAEEEEAAAAAAAAGEGDDFFAGPSGEDEFLDDDGLLETMLIGGLVAALAWLLWYRGQQQQRAEQRRREEGEGQGGQQARNGGAQAAALPGQQADGGFFPPPGDPNFNAWAAGGVGH